MYPGEGRETQCETGFFTPSSVLLKPLAYCEKMSGVSGAIVPFHLIGPKKNKNKNNDTHWVTVHVNSVFLPQFLPANELVCI